MRYSHRVLVVDDNQDLVGSLVALLQLDGHETKGALSAVAITAEVKDFKPEVIILDLRMPGRSGWDAVSDVRRMQLTERPTVIAVTGERVNHDPAAARARGFDYFLVKPVDPKVLLHLVRSHGQRNGASKGM